MDILAGLFVQQPVVLSLLNASVSRRSPLTLAIPVSSSIAQSRPFDVSSPVPDHGAQACEQRKTRRKKKKSDARKKFRSRSKNSSHHARRGRDFTSAHRRGQESKGEEEMGNLEKTLTSSPTFHSRARSNSPENLWLPSTASNTSIFFQETQDMKEQHQQQTSKYDSSNLGQNHNYSEEREYGRGQRILVMPSVEKTIANDINTAELYEYDKRRREVPFEHDSISDNRSSLQERESALRSAQELASYENRRVDVTKAAKKMQFENEEEQQKQLAAFGFRQIAPRALLNEIVLAVAAREGKGVTFPLPSNQNSVVGCDPSFSPVLDTCVAACLLREEERVAIKERPTIVLKDCKPLRSVPIPQPLSVLRKEEEAQWFVREEKNFTSSSSLSSLFGPTSSYLNIFCKGSARDTSTSPVFSSAKCVVIDFGSHSAKAGFAGENEPCVCEPSVVMKEKESWIAGSNISLSFVSSNDESAHMMKIGGPSSFVRSIWDAPFEREAFVSFFKLIFMRLRINADQHKCLLALPPLCSEKDKRAISRILFDVFRMRGLFTDLPSSLMAVYGSLNVAPTCLVIDLGHSALRVSAVVKGYALDSAWHECTRTNSSALDTVLGGKALSRWGASSFTVCACRAPFCKCSHEGSWFLSEEVQKHCSSSSFLLDALFNPRETFDDNDLISLQEYVAQCLMRAPIDFRSVLAQNILLVGGGACAQGLVSRLRQEICVLLPHLVVSVVASTTALDFHLSPWKGGSRLASRTEIPWVASS